MQKTHDGYPIADVPLTTEVLMNVTEAIKKEKCLRYDEAVAKKFTAKNSIKHRS